MSNRINLGDLVKDRVTDYKGIAIGSTDWLHGCRRITVQAKMDSSGKIPDSVTVDEPQLDLIEASVTPQGNKETGGPIPAPKQQASPKR